MGVQRVLLDTLYMQDHGRRKGESVRLSSAERHMSISLLLLFSFFFSRFGVTSPSSLHLPYGVIAVLYRPPADVIPPQPRLIVINTTGPTQYSVHAILVPQSHSSYSCSRSQTPKIYRKHRKHREPQKTLQFQQRHLPQTF